MANVSSAPPRLADYVTSYIEGRTDLKPGSKYNLDLAARYLRAHFGDDIRIDAITKDRARQWRAAVARGELIAKARKLADDSAKPRASTPPSETTVCNITKSAKTIFSQALADDLIALNPFGHLDSSPPEPAKNWEYLSIDVLNKLIAACDPPADDDRCRDDGSMWKAMLGLCRLAGLRRGEAEALPWSGVDLAKWEITVFATKTQRSKSGGKRVVPIDPGLHPILSAARAANPTGERVIEGTENLLRDFDAIRRRAGLPEIAEPFQNMRRSRAQDWSTIVPMNVLADWMGHSIEVAAKWPATFPRQPSLSGGDLRVLGDTAGIFQ